MRRVTSEELAVVQRLLELEGVNDAERLLFQARSSAIIPLADGGMGSIQFGHGKHKGEKRIFGREIASGVSKDIDGVEVHLSILMDQFDDLFELDIWKVDFSSLKQMPTANEIALFRR